MIDYKIHFEQIKSQLTDLLEERKNSNQRDERAVQKFFEANPYALLSVLSGVDSHYDIFGNIIISQPKFRSFDGDRHPDFLIVTWNSLNLYFNFIEIEDPSKKIFSNANQQPSSDFLQAYNQLIQWSSFGKNEVEDYCEELLRSLFNDNFNNTNDKTRHYNHILLYGFSQEITQLGERHNHILQQYFNTQDKHHCTYSRLLSGLRFEQPLFTVRKDTATNKFKAIGFVPFKSYVIGDWSDFHNITHKQELIKSSDLMADDEKEELIKQIDELDNKTLAEIIKINSSDLGTTLHDDFDI